MVSPSRKHERASRSFDRKRRKRIAREPMLIVCEGAETEPIYFRALRSSMRLGAQVVDVRGSGDASDPLSVVRRALDLYEKRQLEGKNPYSSKDTYKRVYCLMDVDNRRTLGPALAAIEEARRRRIPIEAVISSPSFELWYFLHFRYSTRHWNASEDIERALDCTSMLPGYTKNQDYFRILSPLTAQAIENALRLEAFQEGQKGFGIPNPLSTVHRVVTPILAMGEVEDE